jgi:y4mF family transcriptional regulator
MDEVRKIKTPRDLATIVRSVRKENRLDQAAAAALLGVGTRFLGDVERGKATVRLGLVLQVLDRLGLEVTISRRGKRAS